MKKVLVIGAGTTGILAVQLLKHLNEKSLAETGKLEFDILHVKKDNEIIGVGEATIPETTKFMDSIGLHTSKLFKEFDANPKIGVLFKNWGAQQRDVWFAFGNQVKNAYNKEIDAAAYMEGQLPLGIHFNTQSLQSINLGVKTKEAKIQNIADAKAAMPGVNIILNCTGLNGPFKTEQVSNQYLNKLKNNAAFVYGSVEHSQMGNKTFVPYSTFTAMKKGWQWTIPTGKYNRLGYVHNLEDSDAVLEEFKDHIRRVYKIEPKDDDFGYVRFENHISKNPIRYIDDVLVANCGLNAVFVEPLQATGLYLTGLGMELTRKYLEGEITIENANAKMLEECIGTAAFVASNLKHCSIKNDYWNWYKDIEIPQTDMDASNVFTKSETIDLMRSLKLGYQNIANATPSEGIPHADFYRNVLSGVYDEAKNSNF